MNTFTFAVDAGGFKTQTMSLILRVLVLVELLSGLTVVLSKPSVDLALADKMIIRNVDAMADDRTVEFPEPTVGCFPWDSSFCLTDDMCSSSTYCYIGTR